MAFLSALAGTGVSGLDGVGPVLGQANVGAGGDDSDGGIVEENWAGGWGVHFGRGRYSPSGTSPVPRAPKSDLRLRPPESAIRDSASIPNQVPGPVLRLSWQIGTSPSNGDLNGIDIPGQRLLPGYVTKDLPLESFFIHPSFLRICPRSFQEGPNLREGPFDFI